MTTLHRLLLGGLLLACLAPWRPALGEESASLSAEDYGLYSLVLGESRPREGRILLLAPETKLPSPPEDLEAFLEILPRLTNLPPTEGLGEAYRDYVRADRTPLPVEARLVLEVPYRVLPAGEVPGPDPSVADPEAREEKRARDWDAAMEAAGADSLTWLGPIGYSKDRTMAFASTVTQDGPGGLSIWGGRFVLEKGEAGWQVVRRVWTIR